MTDFFTPQLQLLKAMKKMEFKSNAIKKDEI